MIVTNIKDAGRYKSISPAMEKAVNYIQSGAWSNIPSDKVRYPIHEGEVEVMRIIYDPSEESVWENHRNWTDIQMLVSGEEKMLFAPTSDLKVEGEYLVEKDFQKLSGESCQSLIVTPGQLIFFFPEDGHKPGLATERKGTVDKIVFKVIVG